MNEIIRMEDIEKNFPGVKALRGVNLSIKAGEVHGLVGENGAGKSTLIKILMGVHQKDGGKIYLKNEEVEISSPFESKKMGLAAVYQDISLARHLTIGENFFLGNLPKKNGIFVDWEAVYAKTEKILEELGIKVDVRKKLKDISIAQQELVAIAKAVHEEADLLIFDEPTALLANEECEILFNLINKLKSKNKGIIYISHRMEEIFKLCDRVTVLKDGKYIKTLNAKETKEEQLISLMVGREVDEMYSIKQYPQDEVALEVIDLTKKNQFKDISFQIKKGEIFGMFGLVGSGRTEIVNSIFGAEKLDSGKIKLNGEIVDIKSPKDAIKKGIGFATEDRKNLSVAMKLDIKVNTNLASYDKISKFGFINSKSEKENTEIYKKMLNIKTPSIHQKIKNLSGGNQQKVVIAKWLCKGCDVFIFDEPTIGVDVGAKVEIYKIFQDLIKDGAAIILISSYLPEVMGLSNKIAVIHEGNCKGVVDPKNSTEEDILKLASGIH